MLGIKGRDNSEFVQLKIMRAFLCKWLGKLPSEIDAEDAEAVKELFFILEGLGKESPFILLT